MGGVVFLKVHLIPVKIQLDEAKAELPPLEEGAFYWHELIGLSVFERDRCLGTIESIIETGSNEEAKRLIEEMGHYQQQTFHLGGTGPIIRNGSQRFTGIARARREAKKRRNIRARSSKR